VAVPKPRGTSRRFCSWNAAQLSSFRQTLLFIGEPRFYFCIEPNISRSARTPGNFATGMKLLSNAAIDLNESMFSKQRGQLPRCDLLF
jgi:hypothetical protein